MATKTSKTKSKTEEPPKPVAQTFAPIKGKVSTKTHLIAKRTIRCNGRMHEIGLASNGQLWIPSHTKKELEGFVMMGDLGNNPCKCAVVYDAWRNGRYHDDQIHEDFKRELVVHDRLASRLLRHQNKHRAWPNCDIVFGTLQPAIQDENQHYGWTAKPLNKFAEFVAETVYLTLIKRGHAAETMCWEKGQTSVEMDDPGKNPGNTYNSGFSVIFSAHVAGHGYISPYVGGKLIENCAMYDTTPIADIPWRMLVDQSEKYMNYLTVAKAQADKLDKSRTEFEKLATDRVVTFGPLPKHGKIHINNESGLLKLTIEHSKLTIQAANRLVKHYRETEDKVRELLKHNQLRRKTPWRFPAKPSRGLGALVKMVESANQPVSVRAVEGESYEA